VGKCWCGRESLNSWGECLEHTIIMGSEPKSLKRENNQSVDLAPIPYLRNLIARLPDLLILRKATTQDTVDKDSL